MFDNVGLKIEKYSPLEFQKLTDRLGIICPVDSDRVWFNLHNLRIRYFPNENLIRINNSLHKFYNSAIGIMGVPENYNDFNINDMKEVAEELSRIFERPINHFLLSRPIEVGVNIDIFGFTPFEIISRYQCYLAGSSINAFHTIEPRDRGRPITRKCFFTDYKIKFYDKSKQAKLSGSNILRYEIVFDQLRKIRAVLGQENLTMQTLCERETWVHFGLYLLKVYKNIKKLPLIEGKIISVKDLNKIYAECNSQFKSDLKRSLTPTHYNNARLENVECYNFWNNTNENAHILINRKIYKKLKKLINVPVAQLVSNNETELN